MAIYSPSLLLTDADRETLALLGHMALASSSGEGGNVSNDIVPLSPSEASQLLRLLEQFAASKLFVEGSYFSEQISRGNQDENDRLRNIYFAWRSKRGRTRVMSSRHWQEFLVRAGFNSSASAWLWPSYEQRAPVQQMPLDHFVRMEARLAAAAGLHPRVQRLIVAFVEDMIPRLSIVRNGRSHIRNGAIYSRVTGFIDDLVDHVRGYERAPMTRRRIIAISTIVMDTATLFSSRDWTAAGVLSSLAAVAPDAIGIKTPE